MTASPSEDKPVELASKKNKKEPIPEEKAAKKKKRRVYRWKMIVGLMMPFTLQGLFPTFGGPDRRQVGLYLRHPVYVDCSPDHDLAGQRLDSHGRKARSGQRRLSVELCDAQEAGPGEPDAWRSMVSVRTVQSRWGTKKTLPAGAAFDGRLAR